MTIPRQVVDRIGLSQGFNKIPELVFKGLIDPGNLAYLPRSAAETNENFLQLIPYVLITQPERMLTYQRTKLSGENRLSGKHSIGFGGHINSEDRTFHQGLIREIFEEELYGCDVIKHCPKFKGLLLDDANPVGRVHLGVVYTIAVEQDIPIESKDPNISLIGFLPIERLQAMAHYPEAYPMEPWSRICIEGFDRII